MVGWNGMSFHSTHATSQALQPMQVVVSMSLQSVAWRCMPLPGTSPGWPEIFWICSILRSLISGLLCFLELHEEALEFGCESVGIDDRRCQFVHRGLCGLACVFGNTAETPVNRDADLERFFAVDHHRLDAPGDHGFGDIIGARARDLDALAAANAH